MRNIISYTSIMLILILSGCTQENIITMSASSIEFVHEDGSTVSQGECINPDENYAILINVDRDIEGFGVFEKTVIEYTVNGYLESMTFSTAGSQKTIVSLKEGTNVASIVGSSLTTEINYIVQGDFVLVE